MIAFLLQYLETMAEIVRTGIEKANQDLAKEHQDKISQEVSHHNALRSL